MFVKVLMISMDAALLSSQVSETRSRHRDYAARLGDLRIVVCNRRRASEYTDGPLHIVPTNSRHTGSFLFDGLKVANRIVQDWKPDVIATQDPFITGLIGQRLRRKLHVPLLVQDHTTLTGIHGFATESLRNRLLIIPARRVIATADAVRVVHPAEQNGLLRWGIPAARIHVLPVAVNLESFSTPDNSIDWCARLNIPAHALLVLWVGRPVPVKNLPLLLDAFTQVVRALPAARLVLAGDMQGSPYPALIQEKGLSSAVILAGALGHTELPALYQTANLVVLSSNYEGLPRVLLEAAAAGLPIVSTAFNSVREIIREGETGLIVPQRDPGALARAMLTLLQDTDHARAMGQRAQADVLARYDRERLTGDWVNLLRDTAQAGMQKRGAKKAAAL